MFIWKTSKGNKIRLIKIGVTNCYFVEYEGLKILIDTGQKREASKLKSFLKYVLGASVSLDFLVLTHTHYDHAQNTKMIKDKFSSKLIVHKFEAEFLQSGFTNFPKGTNRITKIISDLGNKYAKWFGEYDAVEADIKIEQEFLINNKPGLRIIETPGHSIGSISLIVDDEIAIVGDTLFGTYRNSVLPPFADDEEELFKTWEKLLQTSCKIFLPGHRKAIKRELIEMELKRKVKIHNYEDSFVFGL